MQYDETCLEYFLAHQEQLLPEPVAETMEEAEEFLEDCMAVVCKNLKEVNFYKFPGMGLTKEKMFIILKKFAKQAE